MARDLLLGVVIGAQGLRGEAPDAAERPRAAPHDGRLDGAAPEHLRPELAVAPLELGAARCGKGGVDDGTHGDGKGRGEEGQANLQ